MPVTTSASDRTVTFTIGIQNSQARTIYWYLSGNGVQVDQFETPINGTLTLDQQTTVSVTVKEDAKTLQRFSLIVRDGDQSGNIVLTSNPVTVKQPASWEINVYIGEGGTYDVLVGAGQDLDYHVQGHDILGTVKGRMEIVGTGTTSNMFLPPDGTGPVLHDFTEQDDSTVFSTVLADNNLLVGGTQFKLILRDDTTNEILAESRELTMYVPVVQEGTNAVLVVPDYNAYPFEWTQDDTIPASDSLPYWSTPVIDTPVDDDYMPGMYIKYAPSNRDVTQITMQAKLRASVLGEQIYPSINNSNITFSYFSDVALSNQNNDPFFTCSVQGDKISVRPIKPLPNSSFYGVINFIKVNLNNGYYFIMEADCARITSAGAIRIRLATLRAFKQN